MSSTALTENGRTRTDSVASYTAENLPSSSPGQLFNAIILRAVLSGLPDYRHRLGWYRYAKYLGEGACFSVEARRAKDHSLLAVKHLKGLSASSSQISDEVNDRSLRLALRDLQVLVHPPLRKNDHIIRLLGYGWSVADFYFVQELAENNLRDFLKVTATSLKQKAQFCAEIATGLAALHECAILHGDVKQENVLVVSHPTCQFVCKVSDFTHSVLVRSQSVGHYYTGGTIIYAAPECRKRAFLENDAILRSESFSYRLLCWEIMLSGTPFYRSLQFLVAVECPNIAEELIALPYDAIFKSATEELEVKIPSNKPKMKAFFQLIFDSTLPDKPESRLSMVHLRQKLVLSKPSSNNSLENIVLLPDAIKSGDPIEDTQELVFSELRRGFKEAISDDQRGSLAIDLAFCYLLGWGTAKDELKFLESLETAIRLDGQGSSLVYSRLSLSYGKQHQPGESEDSRPTPLWTIPCFQTQRRFNRQPLRDVESLLFQISSEPSIVFQELSHNPLLESYSSLFRQLCGSREVERVSKICHFIKSDALQQLLNSYDNEGCLPVHYASESGSLPVLRILAEHGASLDMTDNLGRSCLHWLAMFDADQIDDAAAYIHEQGPSAIHQSSKFTYSSALAWEQGGSPLHWAIAAGNLIAVRALLKLGANPTLLVDWPPVREDGKWPKQFQSIFDVMDAVSPLDLAARLHLADCYRELMRSLPSWLQTDMDAHFPMVFRHACMAVPRQTRRIIHAGNYDQAFDNTLEAILESAPNLLHRLDEEVLRLVTITLSELHQEDYVVRGLLERLPLQWYAALGNRLGYEAVASALLPLTKNPSDTGHLQLLLTEFGCSIIVAENPCSPPLPKFLILHQAVGNNQMAALQLLLDAGADTATEPIHKAYLLILAVGSGARDCLELLLNRGYSPHLCQEDGFTPLHFAANKGMLNEAKTLIEHGAKLFTRLQDTEGRKLHKKERSWTLFHSALTNKNPNGFVQFILSTYLGTPLKHRLLQCLDHPNPDEMKFRPLHMASSNGDLPAVVALVRAGAMPGYCVHCEGDQNFPLGPADFLRFWLDSDEYKQETRPYHITRRLEYISEYLQEMQIVQCRERMKFAMSMFNTVLNVPFEEDSQRETLRRMSELGFPTLDDLPDDPEEMDEDYEHEPEDIYAASTLSIKRRMRKTPLWKVVHSMANVFENAADMEEGKPNKIPCSAKMMEEGDDFFIMSEFAPLRELVDACRLRARELEPYNGCKRCQRLSRHRPSFMKEKDSQREDAILYQSSSDEDSGGDSDIEQEAIPGHSHIMIPGAAPVESQLAFCIEASFAMRSDPEWSNLDEKGRMDILEKVGKRFRPGKNWRFPQVDPTFLRPKREDAGSQEASPSETTSKVADTDLQTEPFESGNPSGDDIGFHDPDAARSNKETPTAQSKATGRQPDFLAPYSLEERLEKTMNRIYNISSKEDSFKNST